MENLESNQIKTVSVSKKTINFETKHTCKFCNTYFKKTSHLEQHKTTWKYKLERDVHNALLLKCKKKILREKQKNAKKIAELAKKNSEMEKEIETKDYRLIQLENENRRLNFLVQNKLGSKALEEFESDQKGLYDFGDEHYDLMAGEKFIYTNFGLGLSGDLNIIKKIYFEGFESDTIPIGLKDFSRRKFWIRRNGKKVDVHCRVIARVYLKKIRPYYQKILREKDKRLFEINDTYCHEADSAEKIMQEVLLHETYKQKNVHYRALDTEKYLKRLIIGITGIFGEATAR